MTPRAAAVLTADGRTHPAPDPAAPDTATAASEPFPDRAPYGCVQHEPHGWVNWPDELTTSHCSGITGEPLRPPLVARLPR
ncbi:MAG TPA: hypothetical protein VIQ30_20080 [Pseudonocardia sp.]